MANNLYRVNGGDMQLSTDVDQYADAFNGNNDIGQIVLAPTVQPPSTTSIVLASAAGTTLGIGTYIYRFTYVVGYKKTNGTIMYGNETNGSSSLTITTTSGNQAVSITGLPTSFPSNVVALRIYRTAVNGADGTQKLVVTITTPVSSYTDTIADASLGQSIPTQNLTGTSIAGINALAHSSSLTGLWHFENQLGSTRGIQGTFTRSSAANDPTTLATITTNTPRYSSGKFGKGIFIEEGTTNLVYNSDFETFTGTATVFSDALTSYTGSTVPAPWTLQSGSFTFSASGATSGANSAWITAGNSAWKPLTISNGSALTLTMQATYTMPASVPTTTAFILDLHIDSNNRYTFYSDGTNLRLIKLVGGTATALVSPVAQALTGNSTYTATLSITPSGNLTAKLYSGVGTGGTLLQTLNATDNSLTGGFLIGVGGDTGVVIKNAQVTAPFADGWSVGGDSRVAWALTQNAISGSYSMNAVGVGSGVTGNVRTTNSISVSANTAYSLSVYATSNSLGSGGFGTYSDVAWYNGGSWISSSATNAISGTNVNPNRLQINATSPSNANQAYLYLQITDVGTVTFDVIQLEQKAYATSYVRNDSTSQSATRAAETLTLPSSVLNASASTYVKWINVPPIVGQRQLFVFDGGGSTNKNIQLYIDSNSKPTLVFGTGSTTVTLVSPNTISAGLHQIGYRYSTSGVDLLVDGVKVASSTSAASLTFGTVVYVGSRYDGTLQLSSVLDELAIFNRALTDAEVYSLYAATQPIIDALQSDATTVNGADPVIIAMLYA